MSAGRTLDRFVRALFGAPRDERIDMARMEMARELFDFGLDSLEIAEAMTLDEPGVMRLLDAARAETAPAGASA